MSSSVATLGLNPSCREFVDKDGKELDEGLRRLPTLKSLGLDKWEKVNNEQINIMIKSASSYFMNNPYDTWFRSLDQIISLLNATYYGEKANACHLDLIPYATRCRWTEMSSSQKKFLFDMSENAFCDLLRVSPVKLLILNGASVVRNFEVITNKSLNARRMPQWTLPRNNGVGVVGFSYQTIISRIGDIELGKKIVVLGYNHNIQSSFGVTKQVKKSIQKWIFENANGEFI